MTTKHSSKNKGGGGMLFSLALGAALAAGAGYYATHKEEVDKEAKKRINQLAKMYKETQPQVEKRVREIWGQVSDEAVSSYMEMRAGVINALEDENMSKTGKAMQESYDKIVDKVVASAKKSGMLDKKMEEKVNAMFKQDWQKVGKAFVSTAKKGAAAAKKGVKTAKKKVNAVKKSASKKNVKKVAKKVVKKAAPAKKAAKKMVKKVTKKAAPAKKAAAKKVATKTAKKK